MIDAPKKIFQRKALSAKAEVYALMICEIDQNGSASDLENSRFLNRLTTPSTQPNKVVWSVVNPNILTMSCLWFVSCAIVNFTGYDCYWRRLTELGTWLQRMSV